MCDWQKSGLSCHGEDKFAYKAKTVFKYAPAYQSSWSFESSVLASQSLRPRTYASSAKRLCNPDGSYYTIRFNVCFAHVDLVGRWCKAKALFHIVITRIHMVQTSPGTRLAWDIRPSIRFRRTLNGCRTSSSIVQIPGCLRASPDIAHPSTAPFTQVRQWCTI